MIDSTTWTPRRIRKLREDLQLKQLEFAVRMGVHAVTISMWENGRSHPSELAKRELGRLAAEVAE